MTDSPTLAPLAPEDWPGTLGDIFAEMKGRPLNVHSLMAHNATLLKAWWNFRNYSVGGGGLGKRKGELVILRTAVRLKAWYEWAAHVERGLACGLALEEIQRINCNGTPEGFADDDTLIFRAVDSLFDDRCLSPALRAALSPYYSPSQIQDIMAIHGMYVILGTMIKTWGLAPEDWLSAALPDEVTEESFYVGTAPNSP
ncbi:MAG: carboxymuconolactone decarboxylase family protein [Magnetospiraceae bacterium]